MIGDAPVEPVAAQIHQPAAAIHVGLEGVQHALTVVFGMSSGDDGAVAGDRREPFGLEILVGDHVEGLVELLEPVENVSVGIELPEVGAYPAKMADDFRLHVDDRTQA